MSQPENGSILRKSARGSIYSIAVTGVSIPLGFIRTVLLMRMLNPDLFGYMALALFFSTFISTFSSLGLDGALVQRKEPKSEAFSTHFILRISLSIAMLGVVWLVSPALRQAYSHQIIVVDLLLVLLAVKVLDATYATPTVVLQREMRFRSIAVINLIASLGMTIVAPLLAYLGAGIWALVAEQAVGPLMKWLCLWLIIRPWRISLRFLWEEGKKTIKFGAQLLYSQTLSTMLTRFADFWTGTTLGATALGYYSRAFEIAQYPGRVLAMPIAPVFFSTYSRVQDEKDELTKAFFLSSSFLVRAGFLLAIVLMVSATEVTTLLFGEVWLPVVPIFRLMLVYMLLDPISINLNYFLIGVGKPGLLVRVRAVQVIFFIGAVIGLGSWLGVQGVAVAANLMMVIGIIIMLYLSQRFIQYPVSRIFAWPSVAGFVAGGATLALIPDSLEVNMWVSLFLKWVLVAAIYSIILYVAERNVIHKYGWQMLNTYFKRVV